MRWYRLAAPPRKDPFAFVSKAPGSPQSQKITWPEKEWTPPLDPKDVNIPPAPLHKGTVVNEIVKMISADDVPVDSLVALRDKLRGEGFWQGLMSKPVEGRGVPGEIEEPPTYISRTEQKPETEPLETPGTPAVQRLRERFKSQPPPSASIPKPPSDYENRLRGQSSQ